MVRLKDPWDQSFCFFYGEEKVGDNSDNIWLVKKTTLDSTE